MDSAFQREKELFLLALERDQPAERSAFLTEACGADSQLRGRVEALVLRHEQAGRFLEDSAPTSSPACAAASEPPGMQIGPYKLVDKIGEGGFGEVYLAEQQQPVRRKVALKILKPGLDTREVVARFEAERQALALMDHPNIARVIDGGESVSGRPYFVMELVAGVPITRYCDDRQLTPRDRLALFVMVCQAVQHAHQKGIIHRDLKPSNILIASDHDGCPVPKVIDFGVAKAMGQQLTERTLSTGLGGIIGTLEYMSPEQAEFQARDIDTRADVYSLGVLLYELLTGTTPLTKQRIHDAALTEVLRLVREEEAPKPSSRLADFKDTLVSISAQRSLEPARLTKEVRGELDWIVMKALEKDRNRRFESASALARDIERYLHDEPVEAGPPSAIYRIRKFARKNRVLIGVAAAFIALLVAGAAVSLWQAARAYDAEKDAVAARDREAEARKKAEASAAESKAMFDFVQQRILAAARPKGRQDGLGPGVTLRDAIETAIPFIDVSFANQPLIGARVRRVLGVSYWHFGIGSAAENQLRAAHQVLERILGPDHRDTLACANDLVISIGMQLRFQDAADLAQGLLPKFQRLAETDDALLLQLKNNLAMLYYELKKYDEAIPLHEQLLKAKLAKFGPNHRSTFVTMVNLANCYGSANRKPEALALREKTAALQEANIGLNDFDTRKPAQSREQLPRCETLCRCAEAR